MGHHSTIFTGECHWTLIWRVFLPSPYNILKCGWVASMKAFSFSQHSEQPCGTLSLRGYVYFHLIKFLFWWFQSDYGEDSIAATQLQLSKTLDACDKTLLFREALVSNAATLYGNEIMEFPISLSVSLPGHISQLLPNKLNFWHKSGICGRQSDRGRFSLST